MGTVAEVIPVVRARTAFEIVSVNLSDLLALPDSEAAERLNERMWAWDFVARVYQRSYSERVIIIREFERRHLWRSLIDPDSGMPFTSLTAWLSCSDFLGCRRVNFDAHRDVKFVQDVPAEKLIDVPKGNIRILGQLSPAVRTDQKVLEAAKSLPKKQFLDKLEKDHPNQHFEGTVDFRFSPGRAGAKSVEEAITWAIEHDIAGSRDEALVRMAETALHEWELDEELKSMPEVTCGQTR